MKADRQGGLGRRAAVLVILALLGTFAGGLALGRITNTGSSNQQESATADDPGRLEATPLEVEPTSAPTSTSTPTSTPATAVTVSVEALEAALAPIDEHTIEFVSGTDQLTPAAQAVVNEIATVLVTYPLIPVEVEVKTFTEATPGLNHGLSTLQATAIVNALQAQGVDFNRLAGVGLGSPQDAGAETKQPELVRFDTPDQALSALLRELPTEQLMLDDAGGISAEGQLVLSQVVEAMNTAPSATLAVVGYANAGSSEASHDRSHRLVDATEANLVTLGLDRARVSTIGMGDTPVSDEVGTEVELEIGIAAAMTLALRALDTEQLGFEPHTDRLTPESQEVISAIVEAMALDPETPVEVAAHTYSEDSTSANHDLSHLQGETLAAALVESGVDPAQLVLVGHGDPPHFANFGRDSYFTFYPLD